MLLRTFYFLLFLSDSRVLSQHLRFYILCYLWCIRTHIGWFINIFRCKKFIFHRSTKFSTLQIFVYIVLETNKRQVDYKISRASSTSPGTSLVSPISSSRHRSVIKSVITSAIGSGKGIGAASALQATVLGINLTFFPVTYGDGSIWPTAAPDDLIIQPR